MKTEEGMKLANRFGINFIEASAMALVNVHQIFEDLIDSICEGPKYSLRPIQRTAQNSVDLKQIEPEKSCFSWLCELFFLEKLHASINYNRT